jgi:hypothetical protein
VLRVGAHALKQVLLAGLRKTYHSGPLAALRGDADPSGVRAVRGLWLGVAPGTCFGLLGVNGAGDWLRRRGASAGHLSPRVAAHDLFFEELAAYAHDS